MHNQQAKTVFISFFKKKLPYILYVTFFFNNFFNKKKYIYIHILL